MPEQQIIDKCREMEKKGIGTAGVVGVRGGLNTVQNKCVLTVDKKS